jgi:hypothetical protein
LEEKEGEEEESLKEEEEHPAPKPRKANGAPVLSNLLPSISEKNPKCRLRKSLKGEEELLGEVESGSCVLFITIVFAVLHVLYPVVTISEMNRNLAKQSMHLCYCETSSVSKKTS